MSVKFKFVSIFENRVKNHALKQEAYNKMVNTNAKAAMEFGIDKYKSDPVQIRFLDTAGFRKHKNRIEEIGIKKAIDASRDVEGKVQDLRPDSDTAQKTGL